MEITKTPPATVTAQRTGPKPAAEPRTQAQIAEAQARQAEARHKVSDALARAILAESNVDPVDFHRFNVRLDIHKDTGRLVAEIENKVTGELLQKIPSETILRGAAMLDQVLGTVLDTPA